MHLGLSLFELAGKPMSLNNFLLVMGDQTEELEG
jgi:hypothetical protein